MPEFGQISGDDLERLILGTTTDEAELAPLEEHLLVCADCIERAERIWERVVATISDGTKIEQGLLRDIPSLDADAWEQLVRGTGPPVDVPGKTDEEKAHNYAVAPTRKALWRPHERKKGA